MAVAGGEPAVSCVGPLLAVDCVGGWQSRVFRCDSTAPSGAWGEWSHGGAAGWRGGWRLACWQELSSSAAMQVHENPLDLQIDDETGEDAPPDVLQYEALRSGEEMAHEYKVGTLVKGTVGWLKRMEDAERQRMEMGRLHCRFDVRTGRERDLGACVRDPPRCRACPRVC